MAAACTHTDRIREVTPKTDGCEECLASGGTWVALRMCLTCGHVGCCDSSPEQHASRHAAASGHPIAQSFEPGEDWFWSFVDEQFYAGPELTPPVSHPDEQPVPGPAGRVPRDWQRLLH